MIRREHAPISTPWDVAPAEGKATEVAPGILWMRLPLPMALDHVNVYALADSDGWTIVDTGFDTKRTREIWDKLLSGPLRGKPVARVLVTHNHPDHIGLAGWFQAKGAELITTRTSWLSARMLTLDEQPFPVAETIAFWTSAGMPADEIARRSGERPFNFADTVHPLPLGFRRIQEGGTLRLAGRDWDIRIGNGHAPEHATLWSSDDPVVIGGDQLLPSISPNIGVYAAEPEADPVAEWMESCARLTSHARDNQLVLPGHKLPFTGLPTRMRQLSENHDGALARLRSHLAAPHTAVECFPVLFKREIKGATYTLALVEAMAHVLHLWHRGEVKRSRDTEGAWQWQMKATR